MKFLLIWCITTFALYSTTFAQKKETDQTAPSTLDPGKYNNTTLFGGKEKKKSNISSAKLTTEQKKKEYDERIEANAKKYREMAKEMEKPQYSDPTYFGHTKKPKKHRPGKKKFCKKCGISH